MARILDLGIWLIPIAAIVVYGIVEVIRMILRHQERLAMIERGMHPDSVKKNEAA